MRVEVKNKNDAEDVAAAKKVFNGITVNGPAIKAVPKLDLLSGFDKKVGEEALRRIDKVFETIEIGHFSPQMVPCESLHMGEVGYFISNIKALGDVRVGDTVTMHKGAEVEPLPGYREPQHMVFADFYPTNPGDYEVIRDALEALCLSASSLTFEAASPDASGFGYRCRFLGRLHLDIIEPRL